MWLEHIRDLEACLHSDTIAPTKPHLLMVPLPLGPIFFKPAHSADAHRVQSNAIWLKGFALYNLLYISDFSGKNLSKPHSIVINTNAYVTFISLFCLPEINFGYWFEISVP